MYNTLQRHLAVCLKAITEYMFCIIVVCKCLIFWCSEKKIKVDF